MSSLRPTTGVRVQFVLRQATAPTAAYDVTWFFVDEERHGQADVPTEGSIVLMGGDGLPAYADKVTRAFLRQIQSSVKKGEEWPRRLLRWRPPK